MGGWAARPDRPSSAGAVLALWLPKLERGRWYIIRNYKGESCASEVSSIHPSIQGHENTYLGSGMSSYFESGEEVFKSSTQFRTVDPVCTVVSSPVEFGADPGYCRARPGRRSRCRLRLRSRCRLRHSSWQAFLPSKT